MHRRPEARHVDDGRDDVTSLAIGVGHARPGEVRGERGDDVADPRRGGRA
jgi:hypothetical protein